jgi:hypothetical protein
MPTPATSSSELLRLARGIERSMVQRRKLLARVVQLESDIRTAKRLFRQLADSIGVELEGPVVPERDELAESGS